MPTCIWNSVLLFLLVCALLGAAWLNSISFAGEGAIELIHSETLFFLVLAGLSLKVQGCHFFLKKKEKKELIGVLNLSATNFKL